MTETVSTAAGDVFMWRFESRSSFACLEGVIHWDSMAEYGNELKETMRFPVSYR